MIFVPSFRGLRDANDREAPNVQRSPESAPTFPREFSSYYA
jgi:hypothetical protein